MNSKNDHYGSEDDSDADDFAFTSTSAKQSNLLDNSEYLLKKQDTLMEKSIKTGAKEMNDSDDSDEMVGGINNQKTKNFDSSSDEDGDKIKGDTEQIIKNDIKSNLLKQIV